jgi:hypothetical protein
MKQVFADKKRYYMFCPGCGLKSYLSNWWLAAKVLQYYWKPWGIWDLDCPIGTGGRMEFKDAREVR